MGAVKNRELGQALVAALKSNKMLVKIGIEICDAPLRNQVDKELMRNVDAARRRRQAAKSSAGLAVGQTNARSDFETQILGCSTVAQLTDLVKQEPARGTRTWLVWMVHRVFLNDPSLKKLEADIISGDPATFQKLATALAKNT